MNLSEKELSAYSYWVVSTTLCAIHLYGLSWPDLKPTKHNLLGHWGTNPGIAWILGNLCSQYDSPKPYDLVIGTGHASSLLFAHYAIQQKLPIAKLNYYISQYGQNELYTSELIKWPFERPMYGGELGHAIGFSQGYAFASNSDLVVSIIGDGECETPNTLSSFLHHSVLFKNKSVNWLPVINANGYRMGGASEYKSIIKLEKFLKAAGYKVLVSDDSIKIANKTAKLALDSAMKGERIVWISKTVKGWPAPNYLNKVYYRGAAAHKLPKKINMKSISCQKEITDWISSFSDGFFEPNGSIPSKVSSLAKKTNIEINLRSESGAVQSLVKPIVSSSSWVSPMKGVDLVLSKMVDHIFSPDEASSNRLNKSLAIGKVIEVLSEETCFAWLLGTLSAGKQSAFVTYEAFAPLVSTQIAQYQKLLQNCTQISNPPLPVIVTSLGWGNSPTHQNTDIVGVFLSRKLTNCNIICPIGFESSIMRLESFISTQKNQIGLFVVSKQKLPNVEDTGGDILEIILQNQNYENDDIPTIIAIGDISVFESIAAMTNLSKLGIVVRVVAVVNIRRIDPYITENNTIKEISGRKLGVVWSSARFFESMLWRTFDEIFPVFGFQEKIGISGWETLKNNNLDRFSIMRHIINECDYTNLEEMHDQLESFSDLKNENSATIPSYGNVKLKTRNI